ncbi:MAG: HisA/HisF-related TIM barrel protein [Pseudomonadota bacterium]
MQIIPAIDLRAGRVIRLKQGDYSRETQYSVSGLVQARTYQSAGARRLHLVDLDAALDGGDGNLEQIGQICRALDIPVQMGGGVRNEDDVRARLDAGAERVIIGSVCVRDPARVCKWLDTIGADQIVAGLDVMHSEDQGWLPRAAGWTERGDQDLFTLLDQLTSAGLKQLLCTDIACDGMLSGPNLSLYRQLTERYPTLEVQASGGIGQKAHLERVAQTGVSGCVVGRALLEGLVPLAAIGQFSS